MIHIVSYDLKAPGRDYSKLHSALMSSGEFCVPLESVWLVSVEMSEMQLRDYLLQFIDKNDKIIVIPYSNKIAWYNIGDKVAAWLADHAAS